MKKIITLFSLIFFLLVPFFSVFANPLTPIQTPPYNYIAQVVILIVSVIIEAVVLLVLAKWLMREVGKNNSTRKIILTGLILNCISIPFFWYILLSLFNQILANFYFGYSRFVIYIVCELLILIYEAIIYKNIFKISFRKALILSFCCNLASLLFSLYAIAPNSVVMNFIGWSIFTIHPYQYPF
ncbi:MAG: hypothetical protein WC518_01525 [Patescibacteria group bacterium]